MTFTPKYSSEEKVEAELQISLTSTSNPSNAQLLVWIEETETEIDDSGLGQKTATNITIDVPEELEQEQPPVGTIAWFEEIAEPYYRNRWKRSGRIVYPNLTPIISLSKMYRRTSGLGSTETWEELTEGLANDFIILQGQTKAGLRGYAFYFFDNLPTPGLQRVKATYTYGLLLSNAVLSEYATLKTCLRVLFALSSTSSPTGVRQFVSGIQTYVPTQYQAKITDLKERIIKWESEWLRKEIAVGVL